MGYHMMKLGILFLKDALIGSKKRINSVQRWNLEMSSKECAKQLLHFLQRINLRGNNKVYQVSFLCCLVELSLRFG